MTSLNLPSPRQRADLTFKHNRQHGRHGWLRLTPAYSVKLVRQLLQGKDFKFVLDPFSGSGTTPLCAAELGADGLAVEVNPFLVWLGNAKAGHYETQDLVTAGEAARKLVDDVVGNRAPPVSPPAMYRIERWWSPPVQRYLCALKGAIDGCNLAPGVRDLLLVPFCRTVIGLSNVAYCHPSLSLRANPEPEKLSPTSEQLRLWAELFLAEVAAVAEGAAANPAGTARVVQADARQLRQVAAVEPESFDVLLTSPPYPNRMSYIRELRPYMYWLGYLADARQAGELDWLAIGGTWGVATSRLADWRPDQGDWPAYLDPILVAIEGSHPQNGYLMAQYVRKYFDDMAQHLGTVRSLLRPGAWVHYIVGNSSFYGHLVPVEQVYVDLLAAAGYRQAQARVVRKRNSKKNLYEYLVSARL
jgi:hypothetical protein